ncbi:SDR family NAD(P)-dependent oxidoreductase [Planktotalea sp.]|uniref:SDR family NAD(P)-dependent oxidoreductase n=1 Tax=Planktotalea sp. TaxID=2029877 RepID=UPI003D6A55D3
MNLADWAGSTAIVTGGASGLGAASASALAKAGFKVALFDLNEEKGTSYAQEIDGIFCKVDVSDPASVKAGMDKVVAELGAPRVMINCAGIGLAGKTVSRGEPHTFELFDKTIRINLIGSFNCASQAAALMCELDPMEPDGARGVIINTASVAAFDGQIGQIAYSASKGGIVGMTLPMARDLADKGVRVCSIAPGLFLTPLLESLPEDVQTSLGQQVPFPSRLGQPQEFGKLVCHIIDNPMLNGEVIRLDGAIRMAPR